VPEPLRESGKIMSTTTIPRRRSSFVSSFNNFIHRPIIDNFAWVIFWSIGYILVAPFLLPLIVARFLVNLTYSISDQLASVDSKGHAVVVTGADSGFGREISLQLARVGFLVYAGCLFEDTIPGLQKEAEGLAGELVGIKFDVTSDQDVSSCQAEIANQLRHRGYKGLYALINNAGINKVGRS